MKQVIAVKSGANAAKPEEGEVFSWKFSAESEATVSDTAFCVTDEGNDGSPGKPTLLILPLAEYAMIYVRKGEDG